MNRIGLSVKDILEGLLESLGMNVKIANGAKYKTSEGFAIPVVYLARSQFFVCPDRLGNKR